jgi:hypothetical protein
MRGATAGLLGAALLSVVLSLCAVAPAASATPVVTITSPLNGTVSNEPTPTITGLAEEGLGSVTLRVYRGSQAQGAVIQELSTLVIVAGTWSLGPLEALADGTYTAQASQTNLASETTSQPVTFTVDTAAPRVTLESPPSPSDDTTPSFTGTATDTTPVTVQIHEGATAAGTIVAAASAAGTGGPWTSDPASPALPIGAYTAVAIQPSSLRGNPAGRSTPVSFIVTAAPTITPAVAVFSPPAASFRWIPAAPQTGEPVTFVSTSTGRSSPIRTFAWSLAPGGGFAPGEALIVTSFPTPGSHVVQLRVSDANGLSSTVAETVPVTTPAPKLMEPFPVVRIVGSYDALGARISLLAVQAPVGAIIRVTCHGGGCRTRSQRLTVAAPLHGRARMPAISFHRFERLLRPGAVLEVWIYSSGEIGKFTRLSIHHGKPASRVDLCLDPGGTRPRACQV